MKKAKMSTRRSHGHSKREMNQVQELGMIRKQLEQLEQQRIDFDHRARLARENLYGLRQQEPASGWVEAKIR